jgi:crotonobetainyl-CoA:carnitine CoA-transferase CaiB-like acyl-CoA transferase
MLQSALLQEYPGKRWDEPHGQEATGTGPLDRLYEAADGWLFFAAHDIGIGCCAELADLASKSGETLERALEARMRSRTVADWTQLLNEAGIGAHRVVPSLVELMTDPLVVSRKLAVTRDHEGFGPITTTAPGVRLSGTPMQVGRPAPKPGSDAASVLAEIGMAADLEGLIRNRVVAVDGVKAGC